jgi:hypothetical protein
LISEKRERYFRCLGFLLQEPYQMGIRYLLSVPADLTPIAPGLQPEDPVEVAWSGEKLKWEICGTQGFAIYQFESAAERDRALLIARRITEEDKDLFRTDVTENDKGEQVRRRVMG